MQDTISTLKQSDFTQRTELDLLQRRIQQIQEEHAAEGMWYLVNVVSREQAYVHFGSFVDEIVLFGNFDGVRVAVSRMPVYSCSICLYMFAEQRRVEEASLQEVLTPEMYGCASLNVSRSTLSLTHGL